MMVSWSHGQRQKLFSFEVVNENIQIMFASLQTIRIFAWIDNFLSSTKKKCSTNKQLYSIVKRTLTKRIFIITTNSQKYVRLFVHAMNACIELSTLYIYHQHITIKQHLHRYCQSRHWFHRRINLKSCNEK